ncbi:nucleoside-diphosphate-sugar epimerase [Hyaloraphidium curvatum]|nr:nucleoside-diphosphate-sugar epimerase [Hyaloraphidium curvatum]
MSKPKTAFITGANGFIGNAVAKAFRRAGWTTYGLIRRQEDAADLAMHEIYPIIGNPGYLSFFDALDALGAPAFDVVVSNTEDWNDLGGHLALVRAMLQALLSRDVQKTSGITRPLVMFTSGCKDYGEMAEVDGDPGLAPHTEDSPTNPPEALVPRCSFGLSLLQQRNELYDTTVLRPTIVYGHSSSLYGLLFKLVSQADSILILRANPKAIMHSLHVDDCGEAYVALAEHSDRAAVAQQAFNLSNATYETAKQVGEALARIYGLKVEFRAPDATFGLGDVEGLFNFSQWVGSDKVRALTGWKERRPSFVDGIREYRLASEAFAAAKQGRR